MADSAKGEFQEFKKMKVWVEKKSRCMALYARRLDVTWGFPPYWVWNCYRETSEDNVEVVKLSSVCFLNIRFPHGTEQKRQYSLFQKPRGQWIELSGGSFEVKGEETGEVWFDLCQHGGHWKRGLIIQGIIIKPAEKID
ncbi:hypothetical protein L3X38_016562 [Prunus dulcis]|uniref:Uncharacterized protein n=1 Tax=Prunus dulcis TaxID=3755 RepID=A0AAD4W823_PRUDU|nr:hypothetical protein L3X38_016562 [Prunus dulcis]